MVEGSNSRGSNMVKMSHRHHADLVSARSLCQRAAPARRHRIIPESSQAKLRIRPEPTNSASLSSWHVSSVYCQRFPT
jgi:hypothetical protein